MKFKFLSAFVLSLSFFSLSSIAQTTDPGASSANQSYSTSPQDNSANPASTTDNSMSNTSTNTGSMTGTNSTVDNATSSQSNQVGDQKKEAKILQAIIVIDNNEINAANEALKRASNSSIKDFAQSMLTDHTKNLQDAQALAQQISVSPAPSKKTENLERMGKKQLEKLASAPANQFDMLYIDDMIKGHQEVLDVLNNQLIPHASNPDLVNFLKSTRDTVSKHLDMAKEAKSKLNS